jgi:transposase
MRVQEAHMQTELYTAKELAMMFDIHRGTIRNYVWRGILPPPVGKGRGARYDYRHVYILQEMDRERARRMKVDDWVGKWKLL